MHQSNWDKLEVFSGREKGLFEEIYESGVDFEGNTNASSMVEERMSIAIQFLIGTANLVLKRKEKTNSDFGMAIEGLYVDGGRKNKIGGSMVEAFIGHIRPQQGESLVNELFDKVIDWLNENGSHLGIGGDHQ